jgi:hypothetical protein
MRYAALCGPACGIFDVRLESCGIYVVDLAGFDNEYIRRFGVTFFPKKST